MKQLKTERRRLKAIKKKEHKIPKSMRSDGEMFLYYPSQAKYMKKMVSSLKTLFPLTLTKTIKLQFLPFFSFFSILNPDCQQTCD